MARAFAIDRGSDAAEGWEPGFFGLADDEESAGSKRFREAHPEHVGREGLQIDGEIAAKDEIPCAQRPGGEEISLLLQRELKDPGLGFVTVTEVETTRDLRSAKIFVSVLGDEAQWAASLAALTRARGFIRNWLREHLDLRVTPELEFRADRSMEHAARIQQLLRQLGGER